jgi:hypothetical protein
MVNQPYQKVAQLESQPVRKITKKALVNILVSLHVGG